MLVALPASGGLGVTGMRVSPHYAAFGALAGILGRQRSALIAPTFGGTDRLISAPCRRPPRCCRVCHRVRRAGRRAVPIVLMMTVLGILTGLLQMLIGFLGVGRLIKYIPIRSSAVT